jgi:hypothetical protein
MGVRPYNAVTGRFTLDEIVQAFDGGAVPVMSSTARPSE